MVLHGLDIVVKGDASAPVTVFLNDLEVRYRGEGVHDQNDPKRPPRQPGKITYLAPHMALHEPALAWLKDYYADELARPDLTRMSKLDATLTYAQILDGGKIVVLPQAFLGKGGHELQSVAGDGVSVAIDQSFLLAKRDLLKAGLVKEAAGKAAPSNLAKMGLLLIIAGGLVLLLGIRFIPERASLVDRALSWELTFWSIQFGLLTAAFYMMFTSDAKDAFSLGGLLLAFAYGLAVRYRIRPYLARKWVLFSARHSAPYFLLFLALLASSAAMLMLKRGAAAEHIAAIGYYLLVFGVAVEFISFAKESKMAPGSNEKSLSRP